MRSGTIDVPGARLYHEVRGEGPVLLALPGGPGDAAVYDGLADVLSDRFTFVTLDPRGYSRSVVDVRAEHTVEVAADDAHRLLLHLGARDALVFGGSAGAIVGMELLARHPETVRRLVAHEPPAFAVLPDADEHRAMTDEVVAALESDGPMAAFGRFAAAIGDVMEPREMPQTERVRSMLERQTANAPLMLRYELRSYTTSHQPDVEALRPLADRIVLGVGERTGDNLPSRPARVLADQIGCDLRLFPGAHNGPTARPETFAAHLITAFGL
ncbi:alpha/beta hydrolase [Actinomadura logoneensis]|uniref:Alpha/beta hydrolase n=1 Tax=Actinomadura logoneensis TaxID=2293572 RepID=A0A372JAX5_9ACTN|nr:alpha/beta hydrolase [Actinomadura logoneensis]RFU37163.1 alpha/beta hydrolase [Actinomadura logoneensis]